MKVSVLCITYNQRKYIKTAIDAFLKQVGDFDLEILINDDFSTDGTRDILKEYMARYPDTIKVNLSSYNQYQEEPQRPFIKDRKSVV